MYGELAAIRQTVALTPREALDSAEALLTEQAYEITQRTDTSVTGVRRKREGMFTYSLVDLTVAALPQPQGGVQIKLQGNDRQGVQSRQAEWSRWNESLPKLGKDQQERKGGMQGAASPEMTETRTEEPSSGLREGSKMESDLSRSDQEQKQVAHHTPEPETQAGVAEGDEQSHAPPAQPGRWASVASWGQEPRVAAGKQEAEPSPPQESPGSANRIPSVDEQIKEQASMSDATIPKVVEAESFRLVNEKGEPRAILGVSEDAPYLTLKGTNGGDRILFRIDPEDDSATFALQDSSGNIRVYLGLRSDGSPALIIQDERGREIRRLP